MRPLCFVHAVAVIQGGRCDSGRSDLWIIDQQCENDSPRTGERPFESLVRSLGKASTQRWGLQNRLSNIYFLDFAENT